MRDLAWKPLAFLMPLADALSANAAEAEKISTRLRHDSWRKKVVKMMDSPGQGEAHKFFKGPSGWVTTQTTADKNGTCVELDEEEVDTTGDAAKGSPQDHLCARKQVWHKTWGIDSDTPAPTPCLPQVSPRDVRALPRPSPDDVETVARKFKQRTSICCEGLHPRQFGLLSDSTLSMLIFLWQAMLVVGRPPSIVATI